MRELKRNEIEFVSGGAAAMPKWLSRFIDFVKDLWNRSDCLSEGAGGYTRDGRPCGGGLTDQEIINYCTGVGLAGEAGGRYSMGGGNAMSICDASTKAVEQIRKNKGQGSGGGGGGSGENNQQML